MTKRKKLVQFVLLLEILFSISYTYSQAPNWTVNSADFSLDASLVGQLTIDGVTSTNVNDIIAVFDENNNIRGVAKVSFNTALNKYLIFLSIHSNSSGDKLTFKTYDAANDKVIGTNTNITFTPNTVFGDAVNPFIIEASSTLSVNNFKATKKIDLFPNPMLNNLYFSTDQELKRIKIYSILGKEVMSFLNISSKEKVINVSQLKKGIYLVKATFENDYVITKKIIKQ